MPGEKAGREEASWGGGGGCTQKSRRKSHTRLQLEVRGTETSALFHPLHSGDKDPEAGRPREPGLQRTQTNRQTQSDGAARWKLQGISHFLLAIPASAHGLDHGPVELAPGGLHGWCERGAQALLQHVEQGLAHSLWREGHLVIPQGRKTSLYSAGDKTEVWMGKGSWPFSLLHRVHAS